jgi:hypothetical protein
MLRPLLPLCVALIASPCAPAASFQVPAATAGDMAQLAGRLIADHRDDDRSAYLDTLFRLQLVAGRPGEARKTLADLEALRRSGPNVQAAAATLAWEIYADAKTDQTAHGAALGSAYQTAFRETFHRLDDRMSARVLRALPGPPSPHSDVADELAALKGRTTLTDAEGVKLVRDFLAEDAARQAGPLTAGLVAEDDARRYVVQADIAVRTPEGATVCAMVVRPRSGPARLPALLNFTIYNNEVNYRFARRSAANGYVGVAGLSRGKGCSPDAPSAFEHDGADADALIEWVARQPWSDGRVGMWGGSYTGFTQWAAAKHLPKALKALMPQAAGGPGLDTPTDGGVFENFVYPWPLWTTRNKTLDDALYNDNARWTKLKHDWYVSGRAYRDLDKIDGTPNPVFDRWLQHPTHDAYWRAMIPDKAEFAAIDIPILSTAGYYYGGPGAAVYYFTEHQKYAPRAEHYLLIGPWDHIEAQNGLVDYLGEPVRADSGLTFDPVAIFDMGELRYQWFDYVLKGGPKPELLKDRVNYEVVGQNRWDHAPTIAAMANASRTFHLTGRRAGDGYVLAAQGDPTGGPVTLKVDLADRSDADRVAPGGAVVDKAIDTWNALKFVSAPFTQPMEIAGLFSGRLDVVVNKRDFDISVGLYELTAKGDYVLLSTYVARASEIGDLSRRRLLTPGKPSRLDFQAVRLAARRMAAGSRLVVLLAAVRSPDNDINYGTGKPVSDETIADAGEPLTIAFSGSSVIRLPVRR